jgi:hypothetical protein
MGNAAEEQSDSVAVMGDRLTVTGLLTQFFYISGMIVKFYHGDRAVQCSMENLQQTISNFPIAALTGF